MSNPPHAARYVELTLRLDGRDLDERVLRDIAEFNAQVEAAAAAPPGAAPWLARLT